MRTLEEQTQRLRNRLAEQIVDDVVASTLDRLVAQACMAEERRLAQQEEEAWRFAQLQRMQHPDMAPFRQDLCNWIGSALKVPLQPDTLLRELSDGVVLCRLANAIDNAEDDQRIAEGPYTPKGRRSVGSGRHASMAVTKSTERRGSSAARPALRSGSLSALRPATGSSSSLKKVTTVHPPRSTPSPSSETNTTAPVKITKGGWASVRNKMQAVAQLRVAGLDAGFQRSESNSSVSSTGSQGSNGEGGGAAASTWVPSGISLRPGVTLKVPTEPVRLPEFLYKPADVLNPSIEHIIRSRSLESVAFTADAVRMSDEARDNVQAFINWALRLGLESPDVFEVTDLVQYDNLDRVVFGLYDVARRIRNFGLPSMVFLERWRLRPPPPDPRMPRMLRADPVDVAVHEAMESCVCSEPIKIKRMANGKYYINKDTKATFMRCIEGHLSVQVGRIWKPWAEWLPSVDRYTLK